MEPLVSIIIPTYNHAHFLPYSIGSVLEQTYDRFEALIVDDGSIDSTRELVQGYTDSRLHYIYQSNRGLAGARNTGLRAARGEWISLLDADDMYLPHKLELQVDWLQRHPEYDLVVGGWNYIDETGTQIGGYQPGDDPPDLTLINWLHDCYTNPISVMVRKDWLDRIGGFDERLKQVEDWDVWLRLAYAGCKMGWVNAQICNYRLSPGQMTRNATAQKKAMIQMMDKFFGQPGLPAEILALKPEIYAHLYLIGAAREYGAGQVEAAQDSLCQVLQYQPALAKSWDAASLRALFAYWEDSPYFDGDVVRYRRRIFDNLPQAAGSLRQIKKTALREASLKTFYSAFQARNWRLVQNGAAAVAAYAPAQLLNRGFWSILLQSLRYRK